MKLLGYYWEFKCLVTLSFVCFALITQAQKIGVKPLNNDNHIATTSGGSNTTYICNANMSGDIPNPKDPCSVCQNALYWQTEIGTCSIAHITGFRVRFVSNFNNSSSWATYNLPATQTYFNVHEIFANSVDAFIDLEVFPNLYSIVTIERLMSNGKVIMMGSYFFHGNGETCIGSLDNYRGDGGDDGDICTGAAIEVMVIDLHSTDSVEEIECITDDSNTFSTLTSCLGLMGGNKTRPNQLENALEVALNPNPFHTTANLSFNLPQTAKISLSIFDINGRIITTILHDDLRKKGWSEINYDGTDLQPGIYYYHLEIDGKVQVEKMIKL